MLPARCDRTAQVHCKPQHTHGEPRMQDQGVRLQFLTSFRTGIFDESAAESLSYDAASQTAFFTSAAANEARALDISALAPGGELPPAEALPLPAGYTPSSVSVSGGIVAVALPQVRTPALCATCARVFYAELVQLYETLLRTGCLRTAHECELAAAPSPETIL